ALPGPRSYFTVWPLQSQPYSPLSQSLPPLAPQPLQQCCPGHADGSAAASPLLSGQPRRRARDWRNKVGGMMPQGLYSRQPVEKKRGGVRGTHCPVTGPLPYPPNPPSSTPA
ncbi:hypothetical protein KUCAC02_025630, partial [Chaenocephalus aceratus]